MSRFVPGGSWPEGADVQRALLGRVTVGVCVIIGGMMALAYSDILPEMALVVGMPALVATIVVDTFLYNTFRIEMGTQIWGLIAVFVYLESVGVGLLIRWIKSQVAASRIFSSWR